jgi:GH15 family glucan-1,4-alpha-glucosidase
VSAAERTGRPEACEQIFPRIGSYGFLSDCEAGALVAANGSIEWMCLPRFDSPSYFGALLDRTAGAMRFAPDERVPVARRYEPGTNVIETTWATETGWVIVRDAMIVNAVRSHDGRNRLVAEHMLLRWAHCPEGHSEIELACDVFPDYGRARVDWDLDPELGVATAVVDDVPLRLQADIDLELDDGCIWGVGRLGTDENAFVALAWSDEAKLPGHAGDAARQIYETGQAWRRWLERGKFPDHRWRGELQRSALTLKGLMYAPSGGMVAALTTSLPETPGGERNWDYRYTWIRDATFALWGLHVLGLDQEARDFMEFVERVTADGDGRLQIMYGIDGEEELTESTLGHLHGYLGSRPVRIGNAAYSQRQNDVWGSLLDSVYLHEKALRGRGTQTDRELIRYQVEAAIAAWPHPDQGIWESRGEPQHYVSSKLMIWVAVDRGARLARGAGIEALAEEWQAKADEFKAEILERGVRDGIFRQHYETDALDASLLLIPLFRFLRPDDPRVRDTVDAIASDLSENGLVCRYKVEETDDGLQGKEGTFLICSFWLVSALSEIGEKRRARDLCERLLEAAGWLDLFAEELDAESGQHLGNFPQAFTHLALINAVSHVIADEQREDGGYTAVFTEMGGVREDA